MKIPELAETGRHHCQLFGGKQNVAHQTDGRRSAVVEGQAPASKLRVFSLEEAEAAERAGIDIISVTYDLISTRVSRRGAELLCHSRRRAGQDGCHHRRNPAHGGEVARGQRRREYIARQACRRSGGCATSTFRCAAMSG